MSHLPAGQSDKFYWHRYEPFYEAQFSGLSCDAVLEFGVSHGDSIRWLHERFPQAALFGCDIQEIQSGWLRSDRVRYLQTDQGSPEGLQLLFERVGRELDLIIDDGSHEPRHQRNCLVEGVRHLRPGGLYILEDIHTSHPQHPLFVAAKPFLQPLVGSLHVVLALEHLKTVNLPLSPQATRALTTHSLFSRDDIELLMAKIARIEMFRRALLPLSCYRCGQNAFSYDSMRCRCGAELLSPVDSMTAAIHVH